MTGRRLLISLAIAVAGLAASVSPVSAAPHYNHVFIVVLENEDASSTFGPQTKAPYLAQTLPAQGAYLPNYYATGHFSLDNYLSMVSGQGPNGQTQADCPIFSEFAPGTPAADGQFVGQGCVYPGAVKTIADQLQAAGLSWMGYMQDMGTPCRHPAVNSPDTTQSAKVGDQYAARHNPFVYFHSIIDSPVCQANDVDYSQLFSDISSAKTTPSYAFITPNLCNDGHDEPCVDGQPGGMVQANNFLQGLIPQILASPGYKDRGLIIITFDEAEAAGAGADSSACCNEQPGPNTASPGYLTPGPGGGRVGAVMLSTCIAPGTVVNDPYNHYGLLRSVEDNFGLPHLGFAGQAGLTSFNEQVLNRPTCPGSTCQKATKKKKKKKHSASAAKKKKKKKLKCGAKKKKKKKKKKK